MPDQPLMPSPAQYYEFQQWLQPRLPQVQPPPAEVPGAVPPGPSSTQPSPLPPSQPLFDASTTSSTTLTRLRVPITELPVLPPHITAFFQLLRGQAQAQEAPQVAEAGLEVQAPTLPLAIADAPGSMIPFSPSSANTYGPSAPLEGEGPAIALQGTQQSSNVPAQQPLQLQMPFDVLAQQLASAEGGSWPPMPPQGEEAHPLPELGAAQTEVLPFAPQMTAPTSGPAPSDLATGQAQLASTCQLFYFMFPTPSYYAAFLQFIEETEQRDAVKTFPKTVQLQSLALETQLSSRGRKSGRKRQRRRAESSDEVADDQLSDGSYDGQGDAGNVVQQQTLADQPASTSPGDMQGEELVSRPRTVRKGPMRAAREKSREGSEHPEPSQPQQGRRGRAGRQTQPDSPGSRMAPRRQTATSRRAEAT